MSYRVEWITGGVFFGSVLILLIVPEFALIAVLIVALAALAVLVALAGAALASPYLLARALRRRHAERSHPTTTRRTRWIPQQSDTRPMHSPSGIPSRSGG